MASITLPDLPRLRPQAVSRSSSTSDTLVDDPTPDCLRQIPPSPWQLVPICNVGSGAFGDVFKVANVPFDLASRSAQTFEPWCYALKIIPKLAGNADSVWRERETLLKTTGSDWLCGFVGSWQDATNYYLLMDFVEGGDLATLTTPTVSSRESLRARILDESIDECLDITPREVRLVVVELIIALEELHKRKIIHRDIKPHNIFFDADGHVVLGDYGVSRNFNLSPPLSAFKELSPTLKRRMRKLVKRYNKDQTGKQSTNAAYGSPAYMAPEVWMGIPYSYEADFWSVAVLMYLLLVGRFPFDLGNCRDDLEIRDAILWAPFNLNWDHRGSDRVDSIALDFMERMLKKASTRRLTVEEMKRHPYFDGIDFEEVKARENPGPMAEKVATRIWTSRRERVPVPGTFSTDCDSLTTTATTTKDGLIGVSPGLGFDFDSLEPFPRYVSVRSKFTARVGKLLKRI